MMSPQFLGKDIFSKPVRPLIGGEYVESTAADEIEVLNPSTGVRLASVPAGSAEDAWRAVAAARRVFANGGWSAAPPAMRKATLHRLADMIARDADLFDAIDAAEMGKPVSVRRFNAAAAADHLRFYAEAADKLNGDIFPTDSASFHVLRLVPRGVVAAITPWNFPTYNAVMKIGPALAAGNSVVLKPSELSTFSAMRLGQLALEAGLPEGALNIVPGRGEVVGKILALHDDVDMVSFTGSSEVGKLMQQYAGQSNMKMVLAECGGKSPQIVFDDGVDLDAAADFISLFLLTNQGQVCSAGTRLLVDAGIENALIDRLAQRFGQIRAGEACDPETSFGPLVSREQCAKVMRYIMAATATGAELVTGGERLLPESGGNFVAPTIFRNVAPGSAIAQEEIFGPVLCVTPFKGVEQAIELANATRYGLTCYAWTANLQTGMRLASGVRSSVVVRSGKSSGLGPGHAWTGEPYGLSGIGAEGGMTGFRNYLRHQSVGFFY